MGYASDTYAKLIREQYDDWLNRFYPKQQELMGLAGSGQLMTDQLNRVGENTANSLRSAQTGMDNQLARYGVTKTANSQDNSLSLRSALSTAGAKNGAREAEADRQINVLTGSSAALREQMTIGGN